MPIVDYKKIMTEHRPFS